MAVFVQGIAFVSFLDPMDVMDLGRGGSPVEASPDPTMTQPPSHRIDRVPCGGVPPIGNGIHS